MHEAFLHHIWKHRLYEPEQLQTTEGEPIQVLHPGRHNHDAGPDFFDARLQIGDTLWAGNVEIHRQASDWRQHGHHTNPAYNNVILHLVDRPDATAYNSLGAPVLTAKLPYPAGLLENYQQLLQNDAWVACQDRLAEIDPFVVRFWLGQLAIERLQRKHADIENLLSTNHNNWEETFYQHLARSLGTHVNAAPFEQLARSVPQTMLAKNKDQLLRLEALLFGQAGMLHEASPQPEPYYQSLQQEYHHLKAKYQLRPLEHSQWKYMRLRPANFPTVRIAQLAALVHQSEHLFARVLQTPSLADLQQFFDVEASVYWQTHYNFFRPSKASPKKLGKTAFDTLVVNAIVPILFAYGRYRNDEQYTNRAMEYLEALAPESNHTTDRWRALGMVPRNAAESQALLELKNQYCETRQCLRCAIGSKLVAKPH